VPVGIGRVRFTPGQPIMVSVRINGATPATLMLDTGATRTVINPKVLESVGVNYRDAQRGSIRGVTGEASVLAVRVESIEASGARSGPLLVVAHDTGFGQGDGLLGRDFLDQFSVNIDNAAGSSRSRRSDADGTPGPGRLPETSTGASVLAPMDYKDTLNLPKTSFR